MTTLPPDAPAILGLVLVFAGALGLIGGMIASAISNRRRERLYRDPSDANL